MSELDQYDYVLPRELIAQEPLPHRADARMMVLFRKTGTWEHAHVRDLPLYLKRGDITVLNDTKVIPARLVGRREATGARWTGLYLGSDSTGIWQILGKTRGRIEAGETVRLESPDRKHSATLVLLAKMGGGMWAASPGPEEKEEEALAFLDRMGHVPLPPYIRDSEMGPEDVAAYQTVFAKRPGSVAAPTAGLHFTPELLKSLKREGIEQATVTLHVGIGTFRPVQVERLEDHVMHEERCGITRESCAAIQAAKLGGGRIFAVGTTVVRTLETASQDGELQPFKGKTDIFIRPPYTFRSVDVLLTNFHLPKSTLLVLVRTFGGDELLRAAYAEAIREQYRFFSYGDAMLIL